VVRQRPWFYPVFGFRAYLNKYPLVALFSFLCAFSWVAQSSTPWFYSSYSNLSRVPGYSPWVYTFFLGVPFFALLHLILASPLLQKFKYHLIVYALGLLFFYGFYNYLLKNEMTWMYFTLWFDMTGLAALLWPLVGWKLSKEASHNYLWNFLWSFLTAFLAYLLLTALFTFIPVIFCQILSSFLDSLRIGHPQLPYQMNFFSGPASQTASFLIYPWYLLGGLEKTLNPSEEMGERVIVPGPRTILWVSMGTLIFFLFEVDKLFGQWRAHQTDFISDEKTILLVLTVLCFGMVLNQKGNQWEKRGPLFIKWVSAVFIVFLVFAATLKNYNNYGGFSEVDIYDFFEAMWFIGVFAWFFFRKDPGWTTPVTTLWVMLVLAVAGLLNPLSISCWSHEYILKKTLTEAGMLKDGVLVKLPSGTNPVDFTPIQNALYGVSNIEGLNWFQNSFPPELRDLDWSKEKSRTNLPQLLDWLGREKPPDFSTQNGKTTPPRMYPYYTVGTQPNGALRIGDYEMQSVNTEQRPPRFYKTGYCLLSPYPTQHLNLFYNGQFLAEIPLQSLLRKLAQYDTSDTTRRNVKPEDMLVECENKKVRVKLYLSRIMLHVENGKISIDNCNGTLLAKRK